MGNIEKLSQHVCCDSISQIEWGIERGMTLVDEGSEICLFNCSSQCEVAKTSKMAGERRRKVKLHVHVIDNGIHLDGSRKNYKNFPENVKNCENYDSGILSDVTEIS